jgi:hypothetical protein
MNIDTIYEVLMNMPIQEIYEKCSTTRGFKSVCNSEDFWKKYLYKFTEINEPLPNKTYKQTAKIVFKFIESLFSNLNELQYISTWALKNLFRSINTNLLADINSELFLHISPNIKILFFNNINQAIQSYNDEYLIDNYDFKHSLSFNKANNYLVLFLNKLLSKPMKYINRQQIVQEIPLNLDDTYQFIIERILFSDNMDYEKIGIKMFEYMDTISSCSDF